MLIWIVDDGNGAEKITVIDRALGIDVGLEHYLVDSDGHEIENPRHLKHSLKKLRREQRRFSRMQKGSNNREKQRIIVARTHEKVGNQRDDFQHKLARHCIDNYDLVVTEKLNVNDMMGSRRLSRSIADAGWSSFNQKLSYKTERAGKMFVQVDARGTSQTCPQCGIVAKKMLSQRTHDCPCGYHDTRDHASSLVILERGVQKVRSERPELTLVDSRPLRASANVTQADWLKQEAPPLRAG